jgi:hypothetical protein
LGVEGVLRRDVEADGEDPEGTCVRGEGTDGRDGDGLEVGSGICELLDVPIERGAPGGCIFCDDRGLLVLDGGLIVGTDAVVEVGRGVGADR